VVIKEHGFALSAANEFLLLDLRDLQNRCAALALPNGGTFDIKYPEFSPTDSSLPPACTSNTCIKIRMSHRSKRKMPIRPISRTPMAVRGSLGSGCAYTNKIITALRLIGCAPTISSACWKPGRVDGRKHLLLYVARLQWRS